MVSRCVSFNTVTCSNIDNGFEATQVLLNYFVKSALPHFECIHSWLMFNIGTDRLLDVLSVVLSLLVKEGVNYSHGV